MSNILWSYMTGIVMGAVLTALVILTKVNVDIERGELVMKKDLPQACLGVSNDI